MSNKQQTAVLELIKEMESLIDKPYINPKNALNDCIHLAYAKLKLEKQQRIADMGKMQIIEDVDCDGNVTFIFNPELYYNETYLKE